MAQARVPGPVRTGGGKGAARTPGPFGRNDGPGSGKRFAVTVLDGVGIHRFFHSVAWRSALAQSARLVWNEGSGSLATSLGVDLYNLTLGKVFDPMPGVTWEPPFAEVMTGRDDDIRLRASRLRRRYWEELIVKGRRGGPAAAVAYLKRLEVERTESIRTLNDLASEARTLNDEVVAEIRRKLKFVAGVKLAADAGVGAIGFIAPPAGIAVQLVYGGVSYAIATRVTTSEAEANAAHQLSVGFASAAVDASANGAERVAKRFAEVAGTHSDEAAAIVKNLRAADQSVASNLASRLMLDHQVSLASRSAATANNLRFTAGALKYGAGGALYVYSVWLSYKDYEEAIK